MHATTLLAYCCCSCLMLLHTSQLDAVIASPHYHIAPCSMHTNCYLCHATMPPDGHSASLGDSNPKSSPGGSNLKSSPGGLKPESSTGGSNPKSFQEAQTQNPPQEAQILNPPQEAPTLNPPWPRCITHLVSSCYRYTTPYHTLLLLCFSRCYSRNTPHQTHHTLLLLLLCPTRCCMCVRVGHDHVERHKHHVHVPRRC